MILSRTEGVRVELRLTCVVQRLRKQACESAVDEKCMGLCGKAAGSSGRQIEREMGN